MEDYSILTMDQVEERLAAIDLHAEGADLEALEAEMNALNARKQAIIEAAETRQAEIDQMAEDPIEHPAVEPEERNTKMFELDSKEYREAFFKYLRGQHLEEAEERAITSAADSGAAAIPTETARELVRKILELAPMLSEITLYRAAAGIRVATLLEPDDAYLHAEGAAITASSDALLEVTLGGYEFAKLVQVSKTVQRMSIDAFEGWLIDEITESVANKIENAIINGSGTNQPGGLESITWTAGTNLISTTAAIKYDDICTLLTYPVKGFRRGAKVLCNSTTVYNILAKIKDDQGFPIYVRSMEEGVPARLMGRELLVSDEVADGVVYFGQFRKIFGNLAEDVRVDYSEHSSFKNGLVDYRGFAIFDCKVTAPRAFGKLKKN